MEADFIDQESRQKYKQRRQQDFIKLQAYISQKNFPGLESIAHNLKGNGVSFGYPELSQLGEKLELAAKSSRLDHAKNLVSEFEIWIKTHVKQ